MMAVYYFDHEKKLRTQNDTRKDHVVYSDRYLNTISIYRLPYQKSSDCLLSETEPELNEAYKAM